MRVRRTQAPVKPKASKQFKAGNSGLGLSISRQIARAHGGDVIGSNRPDGQGAYFTLTLPLHNQKAANS